VVLGSAIFVLGLLPVLNIIPIGEVSAERFLYFPSFGVALILGRVFTSALSARFSALRGSPATPPSAAWRSAAGILVPVLVVLSAASVARTLSRNSDWKNGEVLFAKTVAQEPSNARAFASQGAAAERNGDVAGAIQAYRRALELKPDYPIVLSSLAGIHVQRREYETALALIQRAISIDPGDPELLSNLGSIYYETARYQDAARAFGKAIELDPGELRAQFNLGLTLVAEGDSANARVHFEAAAGGGPDFNLAHYYLAIIDEASGNRQRAVIHAREFLSNYTSNDELRRRANLIVDDSAD
jgi:Flp pilus assembly protein TadD